MSSLAGLRSILLVAVILPHMVIAQTAHFQDRTNSAGVSFIHVNGATGQLHLAEILGAGVGTLDFDNDGLLDIWLVQGGPLVNRTGDLPSDELYRNVSKNGRLRFERVTEAMLVSATEYGMGVATGDVNADGYMDVFLANFGPNQLWMNRGNGTFELDQSFARFQSHEWSVAASFVDVNRDGALDLYVVNYVDFSVETHKECLGISHLADYCAPTAYQASKDRLYLNQGDGTFDDVSKVAGVQSIAGGGLGSISADLDDDGLLDLYVANDPTANFLWRNEGESIFHDVAMSTAAAANGDGKTEASMGLVAADYDQDCDVDLFMTNLTAETNTLLRNSGKGWFTDVTNRAGLGASSLPFTGFGTGWIDIDHDGDLDIFVANGAVSLVANESRGSDLHRLSQRNQLWLNDGAGSFVEHMNEELVTVSETSRGAAIADLDNDGAVDLLVANNDGPLRVYENMSMAKNHWIGATVLAKGVVAHHAVVNLTSRPCTSRIVRTDGSYASANDHRVVFGLGKNGAKQKLSVTWPDGTTSTYGPLAIDRYHLLER
ncbi:MAG: CRTAC1 family protein [Gammaproteobacteria bacterium]|nr:CRTAC1 family protein [Gammaproteobacteria bacterium]